MEDYDNGLLDLDDNDGDFLCEDMSTQQFLGQMSPAPSFKGKLAPQATNTTNNSVTDPPKIRVVVRKRPLNKKEEERVEEDIVTVDMNIATLLVNEPKVKVDLTKYTERHVFQFDDTLDENVSNDQVYRSTVQPLVATIFKGGKSTCFAYGQTGSGKTYTMQPLPIRAAADIFAVLQQLPECKDMRLLASCFEIYGGKLFDLLNNRNRLEMREDGRKNVCIVGLEEFLIQSIDDVQQLVEHSGQTRSTGSTGANADSSRSHSIMQFALRRLSSDGVPNKLIGKISFIDLAGSERGADTYDNDKQTRLEGAEINKSLLALKECIRALDSDARHVPFRGSKLTEVLRDSFVGSEARTVMIANISPSASSCEHTLNTLRYADRVKELRKDKTVRFPGNPTPASAADGTSNQRTSSNGAGQENRPLPVNRYPSPPPSRSRATSASAACAVPAGASTAVVRTSVSPSGPAAGAVVAQDALINSILEAEDDLIAAHRKHIEDTMSLVRLEMNLLSEVDLPGSSIQEYVERLNDMLEQKAASILNLQAQLANFVDKLQQEQSISRGR